MKNAIILHGSGGGPESYWHPWLKGELEKRGYKVWVPQLPETKKPDLKNWLPYVLENGECDEETVLIGHSAGCPLILSVLENIGVIIRQAVLVSGFTNSVIGEPMPILQEKYDWEKIKAHCESFVFINSDNDPWSCDDKQGRLMQDKLGGELVVTHEGHFGSTRFDDPCVELPKLLEVIV